MHSKMTSSLSVLWGQIYKQIIHIKYYDRFFI